MNFLEFVIKAKDDASGTLSNLKSKVSGFGQSLGAELLRTAGIGMSIAGVFALVGKAFQQAFEKQRIEAQFKTLLGSMTEAKKMMQSLDEFKNKTAGGLFDDGDVSKAEMNLRKLTDGAMSGAASWKMIGDVATATGNTMESVSFAIGNALGMLKEGMPIDRAMMQLKQLGVVGPDALRALKDLEQQGGSLSQKWDVLTTALQKYNGAMNDMKDTAAGVRAEGLNAFNEGLESIGTVLSSVLVKIRDVSAAMGTLSAGGSLSKPAPMDPQLRLASDVKAEDESKRKIKDALDKAQEKLDREVQKIVALRNAEALSKSPDLLQIQAQKFMDRFSGPGGFDQHLADNSFFAGGGGNLRSEIAGQWQKKSESAVDRRKREMIDAGTYGRGGFDSIGKGAPIIDVDYEKMTPDQKRGIELQNRMSVQDAAAAQRLADMVRRSNRPQLFRVKDAMGFDDPTQSRLGEAVAAGRNLSPEQLRKMDPKVLEAAREEREQRLKDRVAQGHKLTKDEFVFTEQRKQWKEQVEAARKAANEQDAKIKAAQAKVDEVNRLKQKALDQIAANTSNLPDLLLAN